MWLLSEQATTGTDWITQAGLGVALILCLGAIRWLAARLAEVTEARDAAIERLIQQSSLSSTLADRLTRWLDHQGQE